ncbi:MAG: hypothetical protein JNN12_14490 [Bacteroidetes Order II. Incertae sedis bacterium]|nr:hypothetical protein [Bacteroidetes Order II. bacterium]
MKKLFFLLFLVGLIMPEILTAQTTANYNPRRVFPRNAQFGLGVLPGLGAQAGIVFPYEIVTAEAMAQLNFTPAYRNHDTAFHLSASVGGAIRVLSLINQVNEPINQNLDIDVGFRVGPQLKIPADLKLKVEPFLRAVTRLSSGNQAYFEAGTNEPYLRLGMWVQLN